MHTPTALLRPWHVPSGFMMAEEMEFPCKMRLISLIRRAFQIDFHRSGAAIAPFDSLDFDDFGGGR